MKEKNIGTSFDRWLDEEGIRQEVTANAIKRVLATQVATREEYSGGADQYGKQALRRDCGCDA